MSTRLVKLKIARALNHAKIEKLSHYVPGKTKVPVPLARNHDYIGGTFYHGPMSQWKSVDEYREKAEPPVEYWRKDKEERKKYKEKRKKNKRKGMRPTKRMKRRAELSLLLNRIRKNRPYINYSSEQLRKVAQKNKDRPIELREILNETEKREDLRLLRDVKRAFMAAMVKRAREDRPYFNMSSAQLRELVVQNKDNVEELKNVLHELSFRKSMAAKAMLAKVKNLIQQAGSAPAAAPEQLPLPVAPPKLKVEPRVEPKPKVEPIEPEVLLPEEEASAPESAPQPEPEPEPEPEANNWREAKAEIPEEEYKTQLEAVVATKEMPDFGLFGQVKQYLKEKKIREVTVLFHNAVRHLGACWTDHDRVDVVAFDENGEVGGWQGSYGSSTALMYSQDKSAAATAGKINTTIPPNHAILTIRRAWEGRYINRATLHVNTANQAALLPEGEKMDEAKKKRLLEVARVFGSYKSSARPEYLYQIKATQEELNELVEMGIIKCAKGKMPQVTGDSPRYVGYGKGGYNSPFRYPYDLARARLTVKGKNFILEGRR